VRSLIVIWIHDISQAALAVAVATLGVVILLELRCVVKLRRAMDCNLGRVFEQLDLLRFEIQQLGEAQPYARVVRSPAARVLSEVPQAGAVPASKSEHSTPTTTSTTALAPPAAQSAANSGEAKLLASLAAARARRADARANEASADKADKPADSNLRAPAAARSTRLSRIV
jgi:hypothetical protein